MNKINTFLCLLPYFQIVHCIINELLYIRNKMKKIKKIRDSLISRHISTAKLSFKTTKGFITSRKSKSVKEILHGTFSDNIEEIVNELDLMKGALMKAGQMLSLFGGTFLPKELQSVLKKLEGQTSFLEWEQIKKQIPNDWQKELEIEREPLASASLGQVHLISIDNKKYCMKIQYKGVRKAINNDIRTLKLLFKVFNFVPSEINLKSLFSEIKSMLLLETDYKAEAKNTDYFRHLLNNEKAFKVPIVLHRYSNDIVITTEFLKGESLHNIETININQDQRNYLGREFMKLFLMEIFIFEKIQTDAHFGNYLILLDPEPHWGLIDFGATKSPPIKFLIQYQKLILCLKDNNKDGFFDTIYNMGYLSREKESDKDLFWEYAQLIGTPFINEDFDWGKTDIADKVLDYIPLLVKAISIGNPPSDSLFLDRKLGGVFFILQKLRSSFNLNTLINEVLEMKKTALNSANEGENNV